LDEYNKYWRKISWLNYPLNTINIYAIINLMIDNHSSKRNINLVIGLGKSGFWAAKYLRSINKRVIVWESKDGSEFLERKTALEELNIIVSLNKEFVFEEIQPFLKEIESVVISPSIPYDHITIIELKKKGIKVIGEINVAWEILKDTNWIGITGTNGKTTVTHLLSHILCDTGLNAPFAGNIGIPLCKYAHSKKHKKIDWVVAELSSYQIEISPEVRPNIGIWTTFTEDHLERHKTLENYFNIKKSLLEKSDFRIYNYDDKNLRNQYSSLSSGVWITTSFNKSNFILANSEGFCDGYKTSSFTASSVTVAKDEKSMERDYEYSSKCFLKDLDDAEKLGNLAANQTIRKLSPKKIGSEKIAIIFDKRIAKGILSTFASAISSSAISRGTSFLKDKVNQKIFSD